MRRSVLAAILVALGAFVATASGLGFVASRAEAVEAPWAPLEAWLSRVGLISPSPPRTAAPPENVEELFRPFWEAWDVIQQEFYDESAIDEEKLFQGALRGMVGSLSDPYTLYLDPRHRELTEAELRGSFEGIGIQVEMTEQQLRIVSPIAGSPGERAGLRSGDIITHVDGNPMRGLQLGDAIRLIRGPRGSPITLTIERDGQAPFDVTVVREQIRLEAVGGDVRVDGVAYVRISTFTTGVGGQLRRTLDRLRDQSPIGWVLDLRGNPGGTLEGAISVTSQFLDDGVVLYEQRRDGELREIRRRGDARASAGPMAVLVDKGSASASEIVAGALRDNGRAALIGEQTFGKGLVQLVHRLSDGSALRLTVARWLTPKGEAIQGMGLAPEISAVARSGEDAPLAEAVGYVRTQHAAAQRTAARGAPVASQAGGREGEPAEIALLDGGEREVLGGWGLV